MLVVRCEELLNDPHTVFRKLGAANKLWICDYITNLAASSTLLIVK